MGKINLLSFEVANLIAAGEVVDRPSSAVKELLENAIDSGADQITLEIQRGGVTFIRVADNGCGIEKDDLAPAITRHSTSKIKSKADLDSILTLGFRGEALAAISAVSKIRILSKTEDSLLGAVLEAEGGRIASISDAGCQNGTTVIVEELFFNVPARRKFLKKDSTEAIAIGSVIEKIALSRPDISFKFISDGEIKFVTSGKGDLRETMWALFGKEVSKRSLYVEREENGIKVSGYTSEPDMFRSNRNMENFFINGRYIKSKTASAALEQAYSSKIPHDKFPFCVLNIELSPSAVDVNVHPAKLEVKFANEKIIFDAVYYAVLSALEADTVRPELSLDSRAAGQSKAPSISEIQNAFVPLDGGRKKAEQLRLADVKPVRPKAPPLRTQDRFGVLLQSDSEKPTEASPFGKPSFEYREIPQTQTEAQIPTPPATSTMYKNRHSERSDLPRADGEKDSPIGEKFAEEKIISENNSEVIVASVPSVQKVLPVFPGAGKALPPDTPSAEKEETRCESDGEIPEYFIIGEAFNCYVIVEIANRILMIDKHAAHERIIFDELCRKMKENLAGKGRSAQILLVPLTVTLLSTEMEAVNEHKEKMNALGFEFSSQKAGVSTYKIDVTEIPTELEASEAADLFTSLASKLSESTATVESAAEGYFETRLWQASCKAAIKGGRKYDIAHIKWICDRLLKKPGDDNTVIRTCPHGRPVAFEIKKSSIDRQFARLT